MASTRVLPFVRGVDFSHNNFQEEHFPREIKSMTGLRWLKLDSTRIDWIPEEFAALDKLESLSLCRNNLVTLHGELVTMPSLRSLVFRRNHLNNAGLPADLFRLPDLSVLDLSANQLLAVPSELERCRGLLVLNLAHNSIEVIPNQLFINLTDLLHLDLSDNQLGTLPPQMRRLTNLQVLNLANNPGLAHCQFRSLQALPSLRSLNLANTGRTVAAFPTSLDHLATSLTELNLSANALGRLPDVLATLHALRRLNLSENGLSDLSSLASELDTAWPALEVLNLSRNRLQALPASLCKLERLRRLYVNDNQLTFEGLPNGLGKLYNLEVLQAANNRLELIPEGIARCAKLKRLVLSDNLLITLPEAIYLLTELKLDLANNPQLVLPPKPGAEQLTPQAENGAGGRSNSIHNIDQALSNQLRKASTTGAAAAVGAGANCSNGLLGLPASPANSPKDPIARKLRLVRRAKEMAATAEAEASSAKVLKGMTDLANDQQAAAAAASASASNLMKLYEDEQNLKPRRLLDSLEKPNLDYGAYFDEDVGQLPGLTIWEIDNFSPKRLKEEALYGKFYEADCYIVLHSFANENFNLDWEIFYLIGREASLDKKACSAIHAVNLRNHLSAHCRTVREEQGDESDQFLALFADHGGVTYIAGAPRAASGFYIVEEVAVSSRLYRLHELPNSVSRQLYMHSVPLAVASLDERFVYILDTGYRVFVWNGARAKYTVRQKARLLVEKMNKEERKDRSELVFATQHAEPEDFWRAFPEFADEAEAIDLEAIQFRDPSIGADISAFTPAPPVLYQVSLGTGYLELPQVQYRPKPLSKAHFDTRHVFIMDVLTDVYIWIGQKSPRLVRTAALKLAQELFSMISRPEYAVVTRCMEGIETQSFKSRFASWDEISAVDFTRTAESVQKIGADLNKWVAEHSTAKYDLSALFMPRQTPISREEARQLADEWNDDLESMEVFVLEGRRFSKLPEAEMGHFFSGECYVFLCRYWVPVEPPEDLENPTSNEGEEEDDTEVLDETKSVVYFWQGRDASNMGWLTFTFGLQKKFEAFFGEKLEVVRMQQQQENLKFLAHFRQRFVIHRGRRASVLAGAAEVSEDGISRLTRPGEAELYQLRANCDPTTLRCIQIGQNGNSNTVLYSAYCYILKTPLKIRRSSAVDGGAAAAEEEEELEEQKRCLVFLWTGAQCDPEYVEIGREIAAGMFPSPAYETLTIREGEEPEIFKRYIAPNSASSTGPGSFTVDTDCSFIEHVRLFRCSNDRGYFTISEKCTDFCQDDLVDEDIMILDNGAQVFIWLGVRCSEVEVKLAHKSAQVYLQSMKAKQPDRPRTLMLTMKGKETRKFTKCFHGWSAFKAIKDPRIQLDRAMLPVIYEQTGLSAKVKAKVERDQQC